MAAGARRHPRPHRPAGGHLGVCLAAAAGVEHGVGSEFAVGGDRGRYEMGLGTGRPGIEDELRDLGMPSYHRASGSPVTMLRELDAPPFTRPS
jgi:hypothetical protein